MRWARAFAATSIVVSIISVARPFTVPGFPAGHDTPAHLTYAHLFDRAIRQGQFPVRWTEWARGGQGQPLFNFYQPGLYYIVTGVRAATGLSLSRALKLSVVLLWWIGGLLLFLLLSQFGRWPAALGAVHPFPGWRARLDGTDVAIVQSTDTDYMTVRIPPGRHRLEVKSRTLQSVPSPT
jgi:uncharacterized membrane protein